MEIIVKAAAVGASCAVLGLVIKKSSPELALLLSIAGALMIFSLMLTAAENIKSFAETVADSVNLAPASVSAVFKTVGIGITARLSADVCKDAGQSAAASGIELVGAVSALYAALPLMESVIGTIRSLI